MGFTALDYFIVVFYLLGIALLGILTGGKQTSAREYFLGGRTMPWWAVCFAVVATETSTLTFISIPGLAYMTNLNFLQVACGYVIGRIVVAWVFLPAYFRGELQTAYAFLEARFGRRVRMLSSVTFMSTRLIADGVRLFATAIPLALLLRGWHTLTATSNEEVYVIAIVSMAALTLVYTYVGGLRAVIWTDVVQMFLYLGGAVAAGAVLLAEPTVGWTGLWSVPSEKLSVAFTGFGGSLSEFLSRPYTLVASLVGGAFLSMASHGTDHLIVQRLLSVSSLRDSRRALVGSGIIVVVQFALFLMVGVLLYAYYGGSTLSQLGLLKADEILPKFIIERVPTGLSGLIIAGLLAAAMSTLSGSINSLASSTVHDLMKPRRGSDENPQAEIRRSRIVSLGWCLLLVGMAVFFIYNPSRVLVEVALGVASFTYGGLLGLFLLGAIGRRVLPSDAVVGFIVGIIAMILVVRTTTVGWTWYTLIGSGITLLTGLGVNALRRRFFGTTVQELD